MQPRQDIADLIKAAKARKAAAEKAKAQVVANPVQKVAPYRYFISLAGVRNVYVGGKRITFTDKFKNHAAYKTADPEEIKGLLANKYVAEITHDVLGTGGYSSQSD